MWNSIGRSTYLSTYLYVDNTKPIHDGMGFVENINGLLLFHFNYKKKSRHNGRDFVLNYSNTHLLNYFTTPLLDHQHLLQLRFVPARQSRKVNSGRKS